jgi:hypothetical protein
MTNRATITCATLALLRLFLTNAYSHSGPFDGASFKGRIAYSADGNFNDKDDWASSPVALATFARFGVRHKLVHFDYNSILTDTDPNWEKTHEASVLGAAKRYGYDPSVFYDCQKDLEGAIGSIRDAVNASSADNPLYFILAGPMQVPLLGILKAKPEKRVFVYCISHSRWNDGYARNFTFKKNKRDVIPSGVNWVQIADQNRLLSTSPYGRPAKPEAWAPWHWMRDSTDSNLQFLWERMRVSTRPDCSDAGMAWFLMTGDEQADPAKLREVLEYGRISAPNAPRQAVRIEAENFRSLENFVVEERNDRRTSHRLSVSLTDHSSGRIRTAFREPYTASEARYDVDVRYSCPRNAQCRLTLQTGGIVRGEGKRASTGEGWGTYTIHDVPIRAGDEIAVEVQADVTIPIKLDYVQLNYEDRSPSEATRGLDDPDALPGQIITDPENPAWLRYNGGGPVFLAGIGEPENLLYDGKRNPDGSRDGKQLKLIRRILGTGINCVYLIGFVDVRYGGDGTPSKDGTGNPFVNSDIEGDIDQDIVTQWDHWITTLDESGIATIFIFYDDLIDVLADKRMHWDLDANGELHPQEKKYIDAVVTLLKPHRRLIWCVNESANKDYSVEYVARWKRIAQRIREMDEYRHPISIGLVTHTDPNRTPNSSESRYADDSRFDQILAQHIQAEIADQMHDVFLGYWNESQGRYNVMLAQGWPIVHGQDARKKSWAAAMAGAYVMHAMPTRQKNRVWHMERTPITEFRSLGFLARFFESVTELTRMSPKDTLRWGQTKWVLADEADGAYVAYSYEASENLGIRNLAAGTYRLQWLDCANGRSEVENRVSVRGGDTTWPKPSGFGSEAALYVRRVNDD